MDRFPQFPHLQSGDPIGGESKELPLVEAHKDRRCSALDRSIGGHSINTSQAGRSCCSDNTLVDKEPHPKALSGLERETVRTMAPNSGCMLEWPGTF